MHHTLRLNSLTYSLTHSPPTDARQQPNTNPNLPVQGIKYFEFSYFDFDQQGVGTYPYP